MGGWENGVSMKLIHQSMNGGSYNMKDNEEQLYNTVSSRTGGGGSIMAKLG